MKHYKYLFADLDGTLIETVTKSTFPQGVWDMKFKFDVLNEIKRLNPEIVYIVTNQAGIEYGFVNLNNFTLKLEYIRAALMEYFGNWVITRFCSSKDPNDHRRKPNTGMLEECLAPIYDKKDCVMIGNMDSDKQTAINFGIDYYDVKVFLQEPKENTGNQ